MPHAAGAAYALKLDDERQGDCVICYFGDGKSKCDRTLHHQLIYQGLRRKVTSMLLWV